MSIRRKVVDLPIVITLLAVSVIAMIEILTPRVHTMWQVFGAGCFIAIAALVTILWRRIVFLHDTLEGVRSENRVLRGQVRAYRNIMPGMHIDMDIGLHKFTTQVEKLTHQDGKIKQWFCSPFEEDKGTCIHEDLFTEYVINRMQGMPTKEAREALEQPSVH